MSNLDQAKKDWKRARFVATKNRTELAGDVDFSYVVENGITSIYVQETATMMDMLTNVFFFGTKKNGRIYHTGFLSSAERILADLRKKEIPLKTVFIYGYSLGGAVSSIMVDLLYDEGINVYKHITFGEPANVRGPKHIEARKNSVRYVQGIDAITMICFMYKHYNKKTRLPFRGNLKTFLYENHSYWWMSK